MRKRTKQKDIAMTKPQRPPRGTTELPGGGKMIYTGDLTVLDKDGELVSWVSSDLLEILWGNAEADEDVSSGRTGTGDTGENR